MPSRLRREKPPTPHPPRCLRRVSSVPLALRTHGRPLYFFQGWAMTECEGRKSPAGSSGSSPVGVWRQSPQKLTTFFSKGCINTLSTEVLDNICSKKKTIFNISRGEGNPYHTHSRAPLPKAGAPPLFQAGYIRPWLWLYTQMCSLYLTLFLLIFCWFQFTACCDCKWIREIRTFIDYENVHPQQKSYVAYV